MIAEKYPLKPKDSNLLQTMSNFGLLGSILDLYKAMKPQKVIIWLWISANKEI